MSTPPPPHQPGQPGQPWPPGQPQQPGVPGLSGQPVPPPGYPGQQPQDQNPYQHAPQQPQDQNPYQSPGPQPQDQNPYQQPGYQQPNPYTQPTASMAPVGEGPGGVEKAAKGGGGKKIAAIVAATALVVGVGVAGVIVVTGGGDDAADTSDQAGGDVGSDEDDDTEADPAGADGEDEESGEEDERPRDPRGGVSDIPDPVVADDWQAQVHHEREIAYDVPPDWETSTDGTRWHWEVEKEDEEEPLVYPLNAPATYLDEHCGANTHRAILGTTGSLGAVDTEQAAGHNAENYVVAAFDAKLEGEWDDTPAEPFENSQGFTGHIAVSEARDYPYDEEDPCADPSGKVYAVSWVTSGGDIMTWILSLTTGIEDELDQETVDQILDSIRVHNP